MKNKWLRKILSGLSLPPEIDLSLPKLCMYGRDELLIENHRGVINYSEQEASFMTEDGIVTVCGDGLVLQEFGRERACLRGHIKGWCYGARNGCGN